jgi:Na+/H+ antiporter NhaD/arsenite permease-like protein
MWISILRWKRVRLGFLRFIGYGLLITPFSLAAALLVLAAQFALF